MGQKGNTLSIKKLNYPRGSLIPNPKLFINSFTFINTLVKLLSRKNIIVTYKSINFLSNQGIINIQIFFRTSKLIKYKKRKLVQTGSFIYTQKSLKVLNLLKKQFHLFGQNLFVINVEVLNSEINKKLVGFFYTKTKQHLKTLFSRRFSLFIDFVKISALYTLNKVDSESFLLILAQIFKTLQKKRHTKFLAFLKSFFKLIVDQLPLTHRRRSLIKGIKFLISGKLGGKTRSNTSSIVIGNVPAQSVSENVSFVKTHVYTVYGVFGLKLWSSQ